MNPTSLCDLIGSSNLSSLKQFKASLSDFKWKDQLRWRNSRGETPLQLCCRFGTLALFNWLWNQQPDIALLRMDAGGPNALFYCCENDDKSNGLSIIKHLKTILSDVQWNKMLLSRGNNGSTVHMWCCRFGNLEMFKWLWNEKSNISLLDKGDFGRNTLFYCCLNKIKSIGLSILKYLKK